MHKYYVSIISTFLCFALFLSSCKKECGFPGPYQFDLPIILGPALDTFRIGDTIRIESIFEDRVYETKTEKRYHLENWRFHPYTSLMKIDTNPAQDGFDHFEILIAEDIDYERFYFSDGGSGLVGQYSYSSSDGIYLLFFELVTQKGGLYFLFHPPQLGSLDEWQDFPGKKCNATSSEARTTLNGGGDNNVDYLRRSPDPYYSEWIMARPEDRFHRFGGYCFYVVE